MRNPGRRAFSLVEVLVAGAVFLVIALVAHGLYLGATRGEGRDLRRTQAVGLAAEVLEQVVEVHAEFGDLPLREGRLDAAEPATLVLVSSPGGYLHLSPDVPGFARHLEIAEFRAGVEDALVRPDRLYRIAVRVDYPGPAGEDRQELLVTTRARAVIHKTFFEVPPWD